MPASDAPVNREISGRVARAVIALCTIAAVGLGVMAVTGFPSSWRAAGVATHTTTHAPVPPAETIASTPPKGPATPKAAPVTAVAPRRASHADDEDEISEAPVVKKKYWPPEALHSSTPVATSSPSAVGPEVAVAPTSMSAPTVSSATVDAANPPVTISGCLEISVDQEEFRLSDTEGANAPKARSWRSGFLKKGSTPVNLVDPPDRSALRQLVGQRVTATGVLAGRDLRVRSVQSSHAACE